MTVNPLLARLGKKSAHGGRSEKRIAKREIKSRLQPASGAMAGAKSDSVRPKFRIESKATTHESITLKKEWLDKITTEALDTNRVPVLTVSFVVASGNAKQNGDWALLPMWFVKATMDEAEQ